MLSADIQLVQCRNRYYFTGGQTPNPRELKVLEEKAKAAVGMDSAIPSKIEADPGNSALDPKEFRTFKVKEGRSLYVSCHFQRQD